MAQFGPPETLTAHRLSELVGTERATPA